MRWVAALTVMLVLAPWPAGANGEHRGGAAALPTAYEHFVIEACSPCVRDSYAIATLPVAPIPLTWFPRNSAGGGVRQGSIVIEVLRAQALGRSGWPAIALGITLSVVAPGAAMATGDLYRLGSGLLDASEVRALAEGVTAMTKLAPPPATDPTPQSTSTDFHGGTVRVGVLRVGGDQIAYVQVGDQSTLLQRPVWEVPATLYMPLSELPALASALDRATATIEKVRAP
jgi:hypothetical protein